MKCAFTNLGALHSAVPPKALHFFAVAHSLLILIGALSLAGCASSEPTFETEEVDIGYGTQKKRGVTGSAGSVPVEHAQEARPAARLSDLLEGNTAGVRVSQGPNGGVVVRIRGAASVNSSSDPLYVIDGTVVPPARGGGVPWLNPGDVKSITVLKDASAAMYGSRSANGLIIIETK